MCIVLILFTILSGCTSTLRLDENLVRPWKTELNNESPSQKPYIAHHKKSSYELFYLAAHHDNDPKSETHQLVEEIFQKFHPNFLIIESIPNSEGESPIWFIEEARKGMQKDIILGGESSLAAINADQRKIPFVGGEIDHRNIYQELRRQGFTNEDILGFYFVRQIPQWVRQKENKKDLIDKRGASYIAHYCKKFGIETSKCPTVSMIKSWYKNKSGKELDSGIDPEEVAPIYDSDLFTHRISSAIGTIRDRFTLQLIENSLSKHRRVAVVYGGSHYLTLRKGIEAGLGKAVEFILPIADSN